MNILDTKTFKKVMTFKLFMVIFVWGLTPLLLPKDLFPVFGLYPNNFQLMLFRIWGIVVLLDSLFYIYVFKKPHTKFAKYFFLFGIFDNAGVGLIVLVLTPILNLPWGIWINVPFQMLFGYWFWKFWQSHILT